MGRETEEQRLNRLKSQMETARKSIINKSDLKTSYEDRIKQITDDYEDIITNQKAIYENKLNNTIETMTNNFNKQVEQNRLNLIAEHTAEINKLTDTILKQNEASGKAVKQDITNYYSNILDDKNNMINYFKDLISKTIISKSLHQEEQNGYLTKQDLVNGSYGETLKHRLNHSIISRVANDTFGGL